MSDILYSVSAAAVKEMADGAGEFHIPGRLLDDLTEEQAMSILPGSPYTIAQIVAHMHYWQSGNIARARGVLEDRPMHRADAFPEPAAGEWPALRAAFLAGLEEVKRLADERSGSVSADREHAAVGYQLAENALHNAYHLGQIVLLRQLVDLWPPLGGDQNDG